MPDWKESQWLQFVPFRCVCFVSASIAEMELSAGRQTLNMKAFILTMAVVYVQQCEFWLICLLAPSFFWCSCFMLWSHILFLSYIYAPLIWLIFIIMTFLFIYSFIVSQLPAHTSTHTYPTPSLSSIKTSHLTQDGRGGQAEPRGHNRGCIWGVRYWEGHLYFSLRIFTDSDTISCSIWRAFDCEPRTEM